MDFLLKTQKLHTQESLQLRTAIVYTTHYGRNLTHCASSLMQITEQNYSQKTKAGDIMDYRKIWQFKVLDC